MFPFLCDFLVVSEASARVAQPEREREIEWQRRRSFGHRRIGSGAPSELHSEKSPNLSGLPLSFFLSFFLSFSIVCPNRIKSIIALVNVQVSNNNRLTATSHFEQVHFYFFFSFGFFVISICLLGSCGKFPFCEIGFLSIEIHTISYVLFSIQICKVHIFL